MTKTPETVVAEAFTKSREPEYRIPDQDDRDDAEIAVNALREHGLLVEGDLTDETIERAAIAFTCGLDESGREEWAQSGEEYRALIMKDMRAALEAAGVAPVTPSESDWLLLLTPDSGAHRTREWRGRAVDADAAIERAMDENPGWSVHTFGPDVNAKPAPSPDREKLIAEAREAYVHWVAVGASDPVQQAAGERFDGLIAALAAAPVVHEADGETIVRDREGRFWTKAPQSDKWCCGYDSVKPFRTWDELARDRGPLEVFTSGERPVVNKAKLAEVLDSPTHAPAATHSAHDGSCSECPWPVHQLPPEELAHVLVERQREWLRTGR